MRIGYCSPFNPLKSGISDFSEELVVALANHMEVVLFSPVEIENKELKRNFEVHNIDRLDDEKTRASLDLIVYHVGNNWKCHNKIIEKLEKYPGIVELHDFGLHHLVAERASETQNWQEYLNLAEYCHGSRGRKIAEAFLQGVGGPPWETHPFDMSMNRWVLEKATAVIVHSESTKQMVLGIRPDIPIINIRLHSPCLEDDTESFKKESRAKLGLPADKIIMGAFGFATQTKRILQCLEALEHLKKQGTDFLYVIVGEVEPGLKIDSQIRDRNLEDNVIVTGFTSLEDFQSYMGACDFCFNLRYPTQGESSASLHRMLGMGKPAIVTDIGTFADYPDDIAIKVRYDEHEVEDIYQAVMLLLNNKKELVQRGKKALEFAAEYCDIHKNAQRYLAFFTEVIEENWQPDPEDMLIGHICEMKLTDDKYLRHLYEWQV